MPHFGIIQTSYNAGPPGSAMIDQLDIYLQHGPSLNLTEVRQARADMLLDAEALSAEDITKAKAFYARAEDYYLRHGYDADEHLTVDTYPAGCQGTEIMFVEGVKEVGEPGGLLMNHLDGHITADTLTLDDLKEAYDDAGIEAGDSPYADAFVKAFTDYYTAQNMDAGEPVTVTIY